MCLVALCSLARLLTPMGDIQVKPNLVPEKGWADEAAHLVDLMLLHPWAFAILVVIVFAFLILMPGGVAPGLVKYRGVDRRLEHRRKLDIDQAVVKLSKRAERRNRGRAKGRRK